MPDHDPQAVPTVVDALWGQRVRVTSPTGFTWTGHLVGYHSGPVVVLESRAGRLVVLPAWFGAEAAPDA